MHEVVKESIRTLSERQRDAYKKHPDNEGAFLLCKYLKKADIHYQEANDIIKSFYRVARRLKILMSRDGGEIDLFGLNVQICDVWEKVDNDKEKLQKAIEMAESIPVPEKARLIPDEATQKLAKICRCLQDLNDKDEFYISFRMAGKVIGKSHVIGGTRLKALLQYGVIKNIKKNNTFRANRYSFVV